MSYKTIEKLHTKIIKSCIACKGVGVRLRGGLFVDCSCMEQFKKQSIIILSNIPKRYQKFDLRNLTEDFKKQNNIPLSIVYKYLENIPKNVDHGNGLFFQSKEGLGKSALCCLVLLRAMVKGYKVFFIRFSNLIDQIFESMDDSEVKEKLDYMEDCDIVCIDRIDTGYSPNEFVQKRLDNIFNSLYDSETSVLLTSNVPKNKLNLPFVVQMSDLVEIVFVGSSFRSDSKILEDILND